MGGARSEVEPTTTRVLIEAATWDGAEHPPHLAEARAAQRGLGPVREAAAARADDVRPRRVATRLMIELCGARVAPGTIDIGGPGPQPPAIRLRDARLQRPARHRDPARAQPRRSSRRSSSRSPSAEDGLDVTAPPFRRADVTREADVIEEVARLDGARPAAGDAAEPRHEAAGAAHPAPAAAAPRRPTRSPPRACTRSSAGASPAGSRPSACGLAGRAARSRLANPMSAEQSPSCAPRCSARCSTSPARNAAQGARDGAAVRGRRRLPARATAASCPEEPHHLAALLDRARRAAPTWRDPAPARRPTSSPPRACSRGCSHALRRRGRVSCRRSRAVPASRAAAAAIRGRRRRGRLARRAPSERRRRWELGGTVAAFELDLDAVPVAEPPRVQDLTSFPEVREDLAVVVAERRAGGRGARHRPARRRAAARRGRGVRRLPRRRAARRRQGVAGAAPALPRRRPHADRRARSPRRASGSSPRWPNEHDGTRCAVR